MRKIGSAFARFWNETEGQGLSEYLILLILVAIVSIGAVKGLGGAVKSKIDTAKRNIQREVVLE
jgi:Flp pilus assembly pilin Flp